STSRSVGAPRALLEHPLGPLPTYLAGRRDGVRSTVLSAARGRMHVLEHRGAAVEIALSVPTEPQGSTDAARVLDALADAVIVAARDGRIRYANHAASVLLGFSSIDELVGCPIARVIPERLRGAHTLSFGRWRRAGHGRHFGRPMRVAALRTDGAEVQIELVLNAVEFGGEACVA